MSEVAQDTTKPCKTSGKPKTTYQLSELMKEYKVNPLGRWGAISRLSGELGLQYGSIWTWFERQRRKDGIESTKMHTGEYD